jgi:hypothetical protein
MFRLIQDQTVSCVRPGTGLFICPGALLQPTEYSECPTEGRVRADWRRLSRRFLPQRTPKGLDWIVEPQAEGRKRTQDGHAVFVEKSTPTETLAQTQETPGGFHVFPTWHKPVASHVSRGRAAGSCKRSPTHERSLGAGVCLSFPGTVEWLLAALRTFSPVSPQSTERTPLLEPRRGSISRSERRNEIDR